MYNITKLSNKLKISQYYSILKNNNLFFICTVRKDLNLSESKKKIELTNNGFSFKFIGNNKLKSFRFFKNVRSGLNGKIFFIYKKDFSSGDLVSLKYILKNFSILLFSYNNKFYSKKKISGLAKQVTDLSPENMFSGLLGNMYLSFFYKLHLQIESYKDSISPTED